MEKVRQQIGSGIRVYHIGGDVYAECLSESAIFIQSLNLNKRENWIPSKVINLIYTVRLFMESLKPLNINLNFMKKNKF